MVRSLKRPSLKRPSFKKVEELYQKVSAYTQDEEKQLENELLARRVEARFFNRRIVVPLFIGLIVLLLLTSTVVVLREHGKHVDGEELSSTETTLETTRTPEVLQGNFLLALTKNDTRELQMLAVLQVDSVSGELSVFYVPPHLQVLVNNTESSIQRHYVVGGESELTWAVAQATGTQIDRYLIVNGVYLQQIARMFGEHVLNVEEDILYESGGITYNIDKGEQTMSADVLSRYVEYECDRLYRGGDAKVTELLAYFTGGLLCGVSETAMQQRLTLLFRNITSNVTAMDLPAYAASVSQLTAGKETLQIANEGVRGALVLDDE